MGMVNLDIDGYLSNCTKDYIAFREKLEYLIADADDEEQEEMLNMADELHDAIVFLVDTIKFNSKPPEVFPVTREEIDNLGK